MQKYRRWTDESTGINPFIISNQKIKSNYIFTKVLLILLSAIILIVKILLLVLLFLPLYLICRIISSSIANHMMQILLPIIGFTQIINNRNILLKNDKNRSIILLNCICYVDVIYLMSRLKNYGFVRMYFNQQYEISYECIGGIRALIQMLIYKQPFSSRQKNYSKKHHTLQQIHQKYKQQNIVIFYEGLRTNGLGICRIIPALSQQLYKLQEDFIIMKIKYTYNGFKALSMTKIPFLIFCQLLCTCLPQHQIRVKTSLIELKNIHSVIQLNKAIQQFVEENGAKIIETKYNDYDQFLQFYNKN